MTAAPTARATETIIRTAIPEDNAALCRLAGACPVEAAVTVCVRREPDFLALDRLLGDPAEVLVAERAGAIVGCVAWAVREAYVNGNPRLTGYVGDLKVHPHLRRAGVASALALAARERLARHDAALPVLVTTLRGNRSVERLVRGGRGARVARPCGIIRLYGLPLLRARRVARVAGYRVREAERNDLEAMCRLWWEVARPRQFALVGDAEGFERTLRLAPGLEWSSYLLATDGRGRLTAFAAFWDQRLLKTTRVLRSSRRLAVFRAVFNAASPLLGAGRLPRNGETLRAVNAFHVCARTADALRAVLAEAYRRYAGGDVTLLTVGLDLRDPLRAALAGLWAQPTDVLASVATPVGADRAPALLPLPIHYETALV